MKSYKYTLLAAIAACGMAHAAETAYTTPVGYVTKNLPANQFSFVGLTLHSQIIAAGVLDAESATSVTDNEVNFSDLLTSGSTYVLELPDGTIQEITSWSASTLTTPEDITGKVSPGTTTYKIRKAATVSSVFGADNSAGLTPDTDGDFTTNNDLVFVVGIGGAVSTIYYYDDGDAQGWFDSDGNDASNMPIVYSDGFYIKRSGGGPLELVISGEVKKEPTSSMLINGYNYLSSVAPVGLTLGNSGLENFITPDSTGDYLSVDNVYIPQDNGSFVVAYYYNDGDTMGWFDTDGNDASGYALEGDFLILNRGLPKNYTLSVPPSYSSL